MSHSLIYRQLLFAYIKPTSICKHRFYFGKPHRLALLLLLAGDISTNAGPIQTTQLKISCANVCSLSKRAALVESFVSDVQPHSLLLTETWLTSTITDSNLTAINLFIRIGVMIMITLITVTGGVVGLDVLLMKGLIRKL